jgi:hypothetical protein
VSLPSTLVQWQQIHGRSDRTAAELLGLRLGEYRRQRATRPSRQTAVIAAVLAVYGLDFAKLADSAADGASLHDPAA